MWRMTECDRSVWGEPATREPCAIRPVWLDRESSKFRCEGAARPGVPQLACAGFAGPMFCFYGSLVFSARPAPSFPCRSHQTIQPRPDMSAPRSARVVTKINTGVSRSPLTSRRSGGTKWPNAGAKVATVQALSMWTVVAIQPGFDPSRAHPRTPFRKPAPAATKRSSVTPMPRSV